SWRSRCPGTPERAPCTRPRSSATSAARRPGRARWRRPALCPSARRSCPAARLGSPALRLVARGRPSAHVEGELVLADLHLVPLLQALGLDPRAVDVGAVERAQIVEVPLIAATDEQRVVARDGHVVEEHVRVGPATDARALLLEREALALAASTGADHERGPVGCDLVELDRYELARLVDAVGGRHRPAALLARQQRAAALAVVGSLGVDEAALGAVQGHGWLPRPSTAPARSPAGGACDGV